MGKLKEWIVIVAINIHQLVISQELPQNTMLERMDRVEAVLELHGLKMEQIETQMMGFKEKVDRLEIKDRDILGDLSKLDRKIAQFGTSVASFIQPKNGIVKFELGTDEITREQGIMAASSTSNKRMTPPSSNEAKLGMPTNCKDLQILGHTLSGFYLVRIPQQNQGTKIETVYCDFQLPSSSNLNKGFETRIGVVDVKSSSVHFHVELVGVNWGVKGEKIPFNHVVLNDGNGFNSTHRVFRAPYPGTYFFAVSGTKNFVNSDCRVCITVLVNGESIGGEAISSDGTTYGGFSYQLTRKLNATDKLELITKFGKFYSIYFTGWMLEEDLLI